MVRTILVAFIFFAIISSCRQSQVQVPEPSPVSTPDAKITATIYDSGFEYSHDTYNGLSSASDGKIYYVLCSEKIDVAGQFYCFDPETEKIEHLGDLTELCGEKEMKVVAQGQKTRIAELVNYDMNKISPAIISQAAQEGDPIAINIYEQAGYALGVGIANVMVIVTPRRVVLAGGVIAAGELLLEPIRRTVQQRVFVMPKEQVEIVPAGLGINSGIIGSALWAYEQRGAL